MSNRFCVLLAMGLFSVSGFADMVANVATPSKVAQIKPETLASVKKVKPVILNKGGNGVAKLDVEVAKDFHVQANPASQPNLIPTTLTLEATQGLKTGTPEYPKGESYKLAGTPTEVMAYGGIFQIKVPIEAEAAAKSGKQIISGKLRYQACNEKTCFFPVNVAVSIPVTIK